MCPTREYFTIQDHGTDFEANQRREAMRRTMAAPHYSEDEQLAELIAEVARNGFDEDLITPDGLSLMTGTPLWYKCPTNHTPFPNLMLSRRSKDTPSAKPLEERRSTSRHATCSIQAVACEQKSRRSDPRPRGDARTHPLHGLRCQLRHVRSRAQSRLLQMAVVLLPAGSGNL